MCGCGKWLRMSLRRPEAGAHSQSLWAGKAFDLQMPLLAHLAHRRVLEHRFIDGEGLKMPGLAMFLVPAADFAREDRLDASGFWISLGVLLCFLLDFDSFVVFVRVSGWFCQVFLSAWAEVA
jgi:hypothetical protein